jgi:hypothetical protein
MVSYEEFAEWATETFDTKQGELVVYRDPILGNVPGEHELMEQTMAAEELYEQVDDRIAGYDAVDEISLGDFRSRVNELHLSYWAEQGYLPAAEN